VNLTQVSLSCITKLALIPKASPFPDTTIGSLIFSIWMRPVLNRLDGVRDLSDLAGGRFGISERTCLD
jgi:hypothetical protein